MKKFFIALSSALLSITGISAQKHTYKLNVGMFDKVNICDNVNVEYRCVPDSAGYIAFEGEEEFADAFIFSNSKGKLKVQVNTEDVNSPNLPTLRLYSHFLTEIENGSNFTTTIEGMISVPNFNAKQIGNGKIIIRNLQANEVNAGIATGNGEIILSGKCDIANFKMVGTGSIQGENLVAQTVKCHILGSGSILCDAEKRLEVRGIGSTKVYYSGDPEIKKVGGGKVYPLTQDKR